MQTEIISERHNELAAKLFSMNESNVCFFFIAPVQLAAPILTSGGLYDFIWW